MGTPADRLVIPSGGGLRETLLAEVHEALLSGHLGPFKTVKALQTRVWWPNMERTVKAYIKRCPTCQKIKHRTTQAAGQLQPLPIPGKRFESWSMDFITNLPESGGFDAIMVMVDRLTKVTLVEPTTSTVTAVGAAKIVVDRIVRAYGVPKTIVSDRDPRFMSAFWQAFFAKIGSKLCFSTAFHAQTDGQTERHNATLEQILRAYVMELPDGLEWHAYLGMAEFAMNSSVSHSTGVSPFELVYGEHVSEPVDHLVDCNVPAAQDTFSRITQLVDRAKANLAKAQHWQKSYYDKHHSPLELATGM